MGCRLARPIGSVAGFCRAVGGRISRGLRYAVRLADIFASALIRSRLDGYLVPVIEATIDVVQRLFNRPAFGIIYRFGKDH